MLLLCYLFCSQSEIFVFWYSSHFGLFPEVRPSSLVVVMLAHLFIVNNSLKVKFAGRKSKSILHSICANVIFWKSVTSYACVCYTKYTTEVICDLFVTVEKLLSLLPEYVVPYMIHLLAHDPDFTKPQDIDQLRDVKE